MSRRCHNCGRTSWREQPSERTWDVACLWCRHPLWLWPGRIVDCVVTRLMPFGISVEVGDGVDGFIHISELAEEPPSHPAELLTIGDLIEAKVVRADPDARKVALCRLRSRGP